MKKSLSLFLVSSLIAFSSVTTLADSLENNGSKANQAANSMQIKWLGVSLGEISPALHSQLSMHIKNNEGVMIRGVQPNSPAQKAGLQAFDILTSFNGEIVGNSQQVYELVQKSDENKDTKLEIIRASQKQTISAKVGKRDINRSRPSPFQGWPRQNQFGGLPGFNNHPFWNSPPRWNDSFFHHFNNNFDRSFSAPWFNFPNFSNFPKDLGKDLGGNLEGQNVQSFSQSESLSLKTLQNGKIHVELKSKNTDGNEKKFLFEGERDQIIKDIQQQKDLPEAQKQKLLRAIQGSFSSFFNNGLSDNLLPPIPKGPFSQPSEQNNPQKRLSY